MINGRHMIEELEKAVVALRETTPLVASITNAVTVNFVVNAQLAVGGTAAVVYLPEEGEILASIAQSIYINMGTLLPVHEEAIPRLARSAHEYAKPWVLDPVAVGIGSMRTSILEELKEYKPTIIRGNASEIIALAGLWGLDGGVDESNVRGVDSTDQVSAARQAAISLAQCTQGAVIASGEVDLVTDGNLLAFSSGGSYLMPKITGSGCSLSGVAAAYAAVASPFTAALASVAHYNEAGRVAAEKTAAPASFQTQFIDALFTLTAMEIADNKIELEILLPNCP